MEEERLSKNNRIIKDLRKNIRKNNSNLFVVDDLSIIELILSEKINIRELFYCDELITKESTKEILRKIKSNCGQTYLVSKETFLSLATKENAPGILITLTDLEIDKDNIDISKYNRILVTDRIEIPGNLGTIYRTAAATGFDLVINVDPVTNISHTKCIHSSRGMIFKIPTISCSYDFAQKLFNGSEIEPFLGEPDEGENCFVKDFPKRLALVVGNERFGINELWYKNPHQKIFVPMHGTMNSLNVGVATSILMYQIAKNDFQ